jgi:hypothetical protein
MGKSNMIKRADGSYSKRGLWDNIRANKGSGKAPTKEMLKQEKKIKAKYSDGGIININPENKGKFNATKKATGKTTEELTHSKNPVTKKRAIFAQNAAKWKHEDGGEIEKLGTDNTYINTPKRDLTISRFKTGSKNYNDIPESIRKLPLQTGRVDEATLDAVQALTGIGGLAKAGQIGYGAYQLAKPNIINLSKTYRPTYSNALRQAGQALLPFAAGGETDPKNSFGLTGNYSRNPNSEAIESNYKLAADYQRRLGNFNTGLNANLGFNQTMPLNTEVPVMTPMIVPDANVGLNVGYDRNNSNFNGSFNYNPINQGINAEVTYRRRFASGGKTVINPIITKPIGPPTIDNNFTDSNPLNYNLDFLNNTNNSNFNYNQVQENGGIPPNMTYDYDYDYVPNSGAKMLSPKDEFFLKEMKKKESMTEEERENRWGRIPKFPVHHRPTSQSGDENWVLEYAKGGRVLPKYAEAGWLTKNKAGVGAGLGFAGDTTNLLFDNNVFGTRNKVTDSEGNELGEAQSDAGSQTQGALSGALKGASAGAALGPWGMAGGALIGGVAGFLTADTGAEDKLNQIKRERDAQISFKNMLGKGPIENNAIQTNSLALSAYGGYINKKYAAGGMKTLNQNHPNPTEEVEKDESAILPNGMNLAFGGETHENGGLETNLPEGTRIFSDRVKSGKRTIASIAKPIQNKIEKLKENNSKAALNTVKLFENQLDNLFNEQEEIKQIEDMKKQRKYFAKGGTIPMYLEGGVNPPDSVDVPKGFQIYDGTKLITRMPRTHWENIEKQTKKLVKNYKPNKQDAVINYAKEKQAEKEQVNNELGALLDAENSNTVTPYNQNINTIQPRSISKLNTNQGFNQPNRINTPNFSVQPKVNPQLQPTDYKPGSYGFAKDPVLNLNQPVIKPNYVPANSDQADYEYLKEYLKANPDIMKRGNIQPRPLSTLSPLDVKGTKMISPINNGQPFNLNQIKSDIAAEANLKKTPPPSEPRFNKGDIGTAGALGTSLIGNLIQRSNLNKVAPPRTLVAPTFTAGRTPVKADYSADLQAADNQFNAARRGVMMNSGNYSTQAGNLGQLRAEQLRNRSKILQNQNNANVALMNEYQKEQADAANKNAASNYTTDQANMENLYNYNLWKTGQTNAADASAFNTSGQMFNNMVTGQNQLDAAEMYRRMYAQKVQDDLAFKNNAMGGYIPSKSEGDENWVLESRAPRNYFAKGGTVYSQKLQNVLKEDTNTKAAAMDAEYASYLNKEGQPTQNTFKSKITGLDYKVLPRSEKDLYAANLWKETHNTAPTKKQVEATTKALEGKKTSSPGAKTVADTHNSQVPQIEATLPEVTIYGKRSLNPQQMMDNKFGKPQITNQPQEDMWGARSKDNSMWGNKKTDNSMWEREAPVKTGTQTWNKQQDVPTKPVPDWVNKANANKPNFNQVDVNEPVNEKPVVNKPKLKTETPNWLKNPLQPKFDRSEVGEPDNTGSSFNPDANESKIEKGRKYVNNTLKPAIQEFRKNLNEMDINAGVKMNMETVGKISDKGKKVTETFVKNLSNGVKYAIPTSLRVEAKDILNNQLGTNFKITEDDFTDSQKAEILKRLNKYGIIDDYSKYEDEGMNKVSDQWNDTKNVRNSLGLFSSKQIGDTAYIKDVINYNEKQEGKVQKNYPEWYNHWNKGKNMNKWLSYPRAAASTWGSAGTDIPGGDDSKGTPVDIKLYNPKKRTLKK